MEEKSSMVEEQSSIPDAKSSALEQPDERVKESKGTQGEEKGPEFAKRVGLGDAYDVDLMLIRRGKKTSVWVDPGPDVAVSTRLRKINISHEDFEHIVSELEGRKYGTGCRPELDLQIVGRTAPETPPPEPEEEEEEEEEENGDGDGDGEEGHEDEEGNEDNEEDGVEEEEDGDEEADHGEEGAGEEGKKVAPKKKALSKKQLAAKKRAQAKAREKERKAKLREERKRRAFERAAAREKRKLEEEELRRTIDDQVKNCSAHVDDDGKGVKVLFDSNRCAYILSLYQEDQVTLLLRDMPEAAQQVSKAYVRYKDHHDVLTYDNMRGRYWRRFLRQYIKPHLKSFERMKQVEERFKKFYTRKLEEKLLEYDREWAAEELSSTDDSEDEEGLEKAKKKTISAKEKKKLAKKEKADAKREAREKAEFEANMSKSTVSDAS